MQENGIQEKRGKECGENGNAPAKMAGITNLFNPLRTAYSKKFECSTNKKRGCPNVGQPSIQILNYTSPFEEPHAEACGGLDLFKTLSKRITRLNVLRNIESNVVLGSIVSRIASHHRY